MYLFSLSRFLNDRKANEYSRLTWRNIVAIIHWISVVSYCSSWLGILFSMVGELAIVPVAEWNLDPGLSAALCPGVSRGSWPPLPSPRSWGATALAICETGVCHADGILIPRVRGCWYTLVHKWLDYKL